MDFMELLFISLGSAVVVYYGVKLLLFIRMIYPKVWFPISKSFFTSKGEWAVVTGGSDGIGKAYAFELARQGMDVVILSRTKEKLDRVAKEIGETTGQKVKVIVADFTEENDFDEIENNLKDLNIGILVNNVGILPSFIPKKFLETSGDLEQIITKVINCNVKTMLKMCKIILPGMENRGKGVIVNVSSGMASVPLPLYTLYSASKVFVERFSQGLQAEYKPNGITIQAVSPYGVSTQMTGYRKADWMILTADYFVKSSLQYLRAGDKTYGSIGHIVLILHAEFMQKSFEDYVKMTVAVDAAYQP
ncbi:17-beta-hydroxysteroid dehydrogenase type 3 [Diretmus argenteus]